jgi:hypothetical protein
MASLSSWIFHTYIHPDTIQDYQKLSFEACFSIFLKELTDQSEYIKKYLTTSYKYRMLLKLDNTTHNKINHPYSMYYSFYRDRFLTNKTFRTKLFQHYNSNDIFIKGPTLVYNKPSNWYIDCFRLNNNNNDTK